MSTAPTTLKITIDVGITTAFIAPPIPELVDRLAFEGVMFEDTGSGVAMAPTRHVYCDTRDPSVLRIPTSAVPLALNVLRGLGRPVRLVDRRGEMPPPAPYPEFLDSIQDPRLRGILQAIVAHRSGQIGVRGPRVAERQILMLLKLFPSTPTIVLTKTRRRARHLLRWVRRAHSEAVSLSDHHHAPRVEPTRITVCTYGTARRLSGDPSQMVILDDVRDLPDPKACDSVRRVPASRGRWYGLRRDRTRLSPAAEARIWAELGPVIAEAQPDEPVRVVRIVCPAAPMTTTASGLTWKRATLWLSGSRNRWLAEVARAIVAGDDDILPVMGVDPADRQPILTAADAGVALVVESLEHARALQRQLPKWAIVTGATPADTKARGPDRFVSMRSSHGSIITLAGARRHGISAGLVIRADGGAGMGVMGAIRPDCGQRMVMIDVVDDFDIRSRDVSERRRAGYERRGWLPCVGASQPIWRGPGLPIAMPTSAGDDGTNTHATAPIGSAVATAVAAAAQQVQASNNRTRCRSDGRAGASAPSKELPSKLKNTNPPARGAHKVRAAGGTPSLGHRPGQDRPRPTAATAKRPGATARRDAILPPSTRMPKGPQEGNQSAGQRASRKEGNRQ